MGKILGEDLREERERKPNKVGKDLGRKKREALGGGKAGEKDLGEDLGTKALGGKGEK